VSGNAFKDLSENNLGKSKNAREDIIG